MPQDNNYQLVNEIFHHLTGKNQGQEAPQNQYGYQPQGQYGYQPQQYGSAGFNPYEGQNNPLMAMLRQRESGGNYGIRNNLGYSGAYQFGAAALEDLGLLKPGSSRVGNSAMHNPENWNLPGGLDAFLSNPKLQDEAMRSYMEHNRRQLEQTGLINPDTSPEEVNAMLAAAHLGGVGGVKAMKRGQNRRDAYGTSVGDYYRMGLRST
jgi:hypothetical protein